MLDRIKVHIDLKAADPECDFSRYYEKRHGVETGHTNDISGHREELNRRWRRGNLYDRITDRIAGLAGKLKMNVD